MLLNKLRNSPFMATVEAVNTSGFPGSFRTARRRVRGSELKNHVRGKEILFKASSKRRRFLDSSHFF
jgi:hypothetical protein